MIQKIRQVYNLLLENGIPVFLARDPKTKLPSISFTLLLISFTYASVAIGLHIAKATDNTGSALELFYGCATLYFGRTLNLKSKTTTTDKSNVTD